MLARLDKEEEHLMVEANKLILRRYCDELWNPGDVAVADELVAPDIVMHVSGSPEVHGLANYKQEVTALHRGFPDTHFTLLDVIAEGDKVACHYVFRGTHTGEYLGIAPTGKPVTCTGTTIYRIAGGKITEIWGDMNLLGLLQQLGVLPR
jgi:predicted ester cyclase